MADIIGYVDSDWASDVQTRKSVTGYVFTLFGGAISWCSKKQTAVALSSTEAEFMALGLATSQGMFLRNVTTEIFQQIFGNQRRPAQLFGFKAVQEMKDDIRREEIRKEKEVADGMKREALQVMQDNQGSIAIATNNSGTKRIKHIDIKYMFVKDLVKANLIEINYLPTNKMPADFLTKVVSGDVHKRCSKDCGLVPLLRKDIEVLVATSNQKTGAEVRSGSNGSRTSQDIKQ
jgi:hypothetical protein